MFSASTPDLGQLTSTLRQVIRTYGHTHLELEFRFGHRANGAFVPGISEREWTALKKELDDSVQQKKLEEVVVTHTRELICDNGLGKYIVEGDRADSQGQWMHKKRVCDYDIDTETTAWCCRASVSLEELEKPGAKPPPMTHKFMREKHRWSYRYRCWSVDLTRVVSNLPHQLDNDGVSFELEIELVDTTELFVRTLDAVVEWGWLLVSDMCELMCN